MKPWAAMAADERAAWLSGACELAGMGAGLLLDVAGEVVEMDALDSCTVDGGTLHWGEGGREFPVSRVRVLALRVDEGEPWRAVEPPTVPADGGLRPPSANGAG